MQQTKKAFLQKMFPKNNQSASEVWFSSFSNEWRDYKSAEIFDLITDFVANGSFESLRKNVTYNNEKDYAILIRLTDYSNNYKGPFLYTSESAFNFLKKSSLLRGDILISNVGANAGLVYRAPELDLPMTLGPNSILVRSNKYDKDFLYYMLKNNNSTKVIREQIGVSAQPKFNKTEFRLLYFRIPEKDQQTRIGKIFKDIDKIIELQQRELELVKQTKQGFLHKMFPKGE